MTSNKELNSSKLKTEVFEETKTWMDKMDAIKPYYSKFRITKNANLKKEPCHFPEVCSLPMPKWEVIQKEVLKGKAYYFTSLNYNKPRTLEECEKIIEGYKVNLTKNNIPDKLEVVWRFEGTI